MSFSSIFFPKHCEKEFTTKYSLERHWKRFADHAGALPLNPSQLAKKAVKTSKQIKAPKPNQLHIQGAALRTAHPALAAAVPAEQTEPKLPNYSYPQEYHYNIKDAQENATLRLPSAAVVEETPAPIRFVEGACESPSSWEFPFLPHYLESDALLNATPQVPFQSPPLQLRSPLTSHFGRIFGNDDSHQGLATTASSESVPSNYESGNRFSGPEEASKIPSRTPVKLADLDCKFLLGDQEATSPFSFLEKTYTGPPVMPSGASLEMLPYDYDMHCNRNGSSSKGAANVSLTDFDLDFLAPTV